MGVGKGLVRADGKAKVTGKALYIDDIRPDDCLYGATVRSPHPHARILDIQRDPNYDWEGVTLITAADIPGENTIYLMTKDQPALADKLVRHVTEPVALVAAPTREKALEAVQHVQVNYEPLPALLDYKSSADNDIKIFGEDNIFKKITIEKGDPSTVEGTHTFEGEYFSSLQEQMYIEPQGIIAIPQPKTDDQEEGMTIMGSMQCPYYVVKALEGLLGHSRTNVVQTTTGGGFGGKEEYPSMISAHAALLAQKTGRPVKLIYRRDEDLQCTTKRHPGTVWMKTKVDENGQLLSLESNLIYDGGAYNTLSPVVLSRAILHVTGPYHFPHVKLDGKMVATHQPPNGAFRGFGAPQAHWAIERHMDHMARELKLDPIEFRRQNLFKEGDLTATNQPMEDPAGHTVLDAVLEEVKNSEPATAHPRPGVDMKTARMARGTGLSMVFHGCGFTGNGEANIKGRVALKLEGNKVYILTSSTDIGQGVDTIFPQIVAEELGLSLEQVIVSPHDTADVPDSGPTVASRTTMVVGQVVLDAAKKLRSAVEAELGKKGNFLELLKERDGETALQVEHVYTPHAQMTWNPDTYQGDAYPTYGWNCTWVDLSVDLDTGEVQYHRVITATDVGKAINPTLVTGQIEGGTLQALGWATCEEVVIDDNGLMKNNRFTNYIIPTTLDAPEMKTLIVEVPFVGGPFGAKGIGEIPMDGPAAAVAQAIENATGVVVNALPMTPEVIMKDL